MLLSLLLLPLPLLLLLLLPLLLLLLLPLLLLPLLLLLLLMMLLLLLTDAAATGPVEGAAGAAAGDGGEGCGEPAAGGARCDGRLCGHPHSSLCAHDAVVSVVWGPVRRLAVGIAWFILWSRRIPHLPPLATTAMRTRSSMSFSGNLWEVGKKHWQPASLMTTVPAILTGGWLVS
jgi:hypothetical protein